MDDAVIETHAQASQAIVALTDAYRDRCLWFLRSDYYPTTLADQLRVLDYLDRYGDREAFQRSGILRTWLLHHSNATSAAS